MIALLAAASFVALAADEPKPTVKVSGLLFPQWSLDLAQGADGANAFSVERTYLRVEGTITPTVSARLTLDAKRGQSQSITLTDGSTIVVSGDERYGVFVKQAWVEWRPSEQITTRGGIIDTPMVPYLESGRHQRWIHKTFLDDADLASSADVGVNVTGKHAKGLLSWTAGLYNGETYKSPESGAGKSAQARVTVDPLAPGGEGLSLPITVFVNENLQDGDTPDVFVWAGDVAFDSPYLLATAEVAGSSQGGVQGLGFSGSVAPGVPKIGFILVRVDHWDPDAAVPGDDHTTLIAGPAHDFLEKLSVGVFYERTMSADAPEQAVFLRGQVGF